MRDLPPDFPLTPGQQRVVKLWSRVGNSFQTSCPKPSRTLGPPASYLDFETFSPAIPLYAGTSPYQRIPFQWSMHHDDGAGEVRHFEFLADGDVDPRREFTETLLKATACLSGPIIVYSGFEASVLRSLAGFCPIYPTDCSW